MRTFVRRAQGSGGRHGAPAVRPASPLLCCRGGSTLRQYADSLLACLLGLTMVVHGTWPFSTSMRCSCQAAVWLIGCLPGGTSPG
jgi:hypothetical protein